MGKIKTLWVGMKTVVWPEGGTDSSIVLIINESGQPADAVHATLPDSSQSDQESGQANLYQLDLNDETPHESRTFAVQNLNESSIRIGIRGDDQWEPGSCFVWGRQTDGVIVPLALNVVEQGFKAGEVPTMAISTTRTEGRTSFGVRRVQTGDGLTPIVRMILLVTTADEDEAGTDHTITLTITDVTGRLLLDHTFTDTFQNDLERGEANFYYIDFEGTILKSQLNEDSIRLKINGDDAWVPTSLFLFGLDRRGETVNFVTPLVHLPEWPFGVMSLDQGEGTPAVTLPLA